MKGQRMLAGLVLGAAVLLASGQAAHALQVQITRISGYFAGSGGEFSLRVTSGSIAHLSYHSNALVSSDGHTWFQSFCLELNETIGLPETVNASLSHKAIHGGVGPAGDPISLGTAWLYSQFAMGTLSGYAYSPLGTGPLGPNNGRSESAQLLQEAIWCLEDEAGCSETNPFLNQAITKFGTLANAKQDANGAYGVLVLNTTAVSGGGLRQDMLVHVVPEPASMVLLGSGLLGLPFLRKKFGKKS